MKTRNQVILKKLQEEELKIFKEFICVCEKLNLNYYLVGGTLIGAIRHKGFIPWDDDIDVCMLRKEYDIFIKEAQKYLPNNLFLQTNNTDKEYSNCFAKIRNSETTFIENSVKNSNINHGIYIDIFPLDNLYNYNTLKDKLIKMSLYKEYYENKNDLKTKTLLFISKMLYGNKTKEKLVNILEIMYTKRNNKRTKKVVNYGGAWGIKKESHLLEDYSDFKLVDFENIKVKVPIGYDRCLRDTYGDYMKLPPEEQRKPHHFSETIDTKKSYKYYIDRKEKMQ